MFKKIFCLLNFLVFSFYYSNLYAQIDCSINAGVPQSICLSTAMSGGFQLNGELPVNTDASILWTSTNSEIIFSDPTIVNPTITFPVGTQGGDAFTFTITANCNNVPDPTSNDVTITILPNPVADIIQEGIIFSDCNSTITLNANSINGDENSSWSVPSISGVTSSPSGSTLNISSINSTEDIPITYIVTNSLGCSSSDQVFINFDCSGGSGGNGNINIDICTYWEENSTDSYTVTLPNGVTFMSATDVNIIFDGGTTIEGIEINELEYVDNNFNLSIPHSNLVPGTYNFSYSVNAPSPVSSGTITLTIHPTLNYYGLNANEYMPNYPSTTFYCMDFTANFTAPMLPDDFPISITNYYMMNGIIDLVPFITSDPPLIFENNVDVIFPFDNNYREINYVIDGSYGDNSNILCDYIAKPFKFIPLDLSSQNLVFPCGKNDIYPSDWNQALDNVLDFSYLFSQYISIINTSAIDYSTDPPTILPTLSNTLGVNTNVINSPSGTYTFNAFLPTPQVGDDYQIIGDCNFSTTFTITIVGVPEPINAGSSQYICGNNAFLNGNTPENSTTIGTWSVVSIDPSSSPMPTIVQINNPNSEIIGLTDNTVYTLQWQFGNDMHPECATQDITTITTGVCPEENPKLCESINLNYTVEEGNNFIFTIEDIPTGFTILQQTWDYGDGITEVIEGGTFPSHIYNDLSTITSACVTVLFFNNSDSVFYTCNDCIDLNVTQICNLGTFALAPCGSWLLPANGEKNSANEKMNCNECSGYGYPLYIYDISTDPPTLIINNDDYTFLWSNGATTPSIIGMPNEHYSVVISCSTGESVTIEFQSECCAVTKPENLHCEIQEIGGLISHLLVWDPVPNAIYYNIIITFKDPYCCVLDKFEFPTSTMLTSPTNSVSNPNFKSCFSWYVVAVCNDSIISDKSDVMCYDLGCTEPITSIECATLESPINLHCQSFIDEQTNLWFSQITWDEVPNAHHYIINFYPYNAKCCKQPSSGQIGIPYSVSVLNNYYSLPNYQSCFAYEVIAVCEDGTQSNVSERVCYNSNECQIIDDPTPIIIECCHEFRYFHSIIPNPTKGYFEIKWDEKIPKDTKGIIYIYDSFGNVVYKEQLIIGDKFNYDLTKYKNGIYYILLFDLYGKKLDEVKFEKF